MFMLTVSTVLIVENGVIVLKDKPLEQSFTTYKFPGGMVRASSETIQFAAVRYVKEQTGIMLKKELLIPVDFRSDPDRSEEGNLVDIGFVCVLDRIMPDHLSSNTQAKWIEIDFENKKPLKLTDEKFYMNHDILLHRAIDVVLMVK
jgi:ADP-ribose pyrophosphatase YjhB (NUDIX family)